MNGGCQQSQSLLNFIDWLNRRTFNWPHNNFNILCLYRKEFSSNVDIPTWWRDICFYLGNGKWIMISPHSRAPDEASIHDKILYSSSKQYLKNAMNGNHPSSHIQVHSVKRWKLICCLFYRYQTWPGVPVACRYCRQKMFYREVWKADSHTWGQETKMRNCWIIMLTAVLQQDTL